MTYPSKAFHCRPVTVPLGCCYLGQLLAQHLHSQEGEVPGVNILKKKNKFSPCDQG